MEIAGYEGLYYIEPNGKIYSMDRTVEYKDGRVYFYEGQVLIPSTDTSGYYHVVLYKNGIPKTYRVHRLVALTYLDNPNNYPCVNHKDCNRQNNDLENLEWCTQEYNTQSINTTKNFGWVYYRTDRNRHVALYTSNKVTRTKHFKTKEEAQNWLDSQMLNIQKNNLINN